MTRARHPLAVALVIVALVGAAVLLVSFADRREAPEQGLSPDAHGVPADEQSSMTAVDPRHSAPTRVASEKHPAPASVRRHSSATEADAILGAVAAGDRWAIERRIDLAGTCRPFVTGRPTELPSTLLVQRIARYCADYADLLDDQSLQSAMADRDAGYLATVEALFALRAEGGDGALDGELQRLSVSNDPADVAAMLQFGSEARVRLPGVPTERFDDPLLDWSAVYESAALLHRCRDVADCGPDGIYTYFGCIAWGLCTDGITYRDQVRALSTPIAFREASELLDRMRRRPND